MKGVNKLLAVPALALGLTACDPLDTSATRLCQAINLQSDSEPQGIEWASKGFRQKIKSLGIVELKFSKLVSDASHFDMTVVMGDKAEFIVKDAVYATPEYKNPNALLKVFHESLEKTLLHQIGQNRDVIAQHVCAENK